MDYGKIEPSAVPHVTTLGKNFLIDYRKYQFSIAIESSFILFVLPLLAIWIYFSSKYKDNKKGKKNE